MASPINLPKKLGIIVASTLVHVFVFDVIGVIMSFFFDTFASSRRTSTALYYAIWFVMGVFCGMSSYFVTGGFISPDQPKESKRDWTDGPDQGKTGLLLIFMTALILGLLLIPCQHFLWRYNMMDTVFVPDNEHLTITFFVTIVATTIFTHQIARPEQKKASRPFRPRVRKPTHLE